MWLGFHCSVTVNFRLVKFAVKLFYFGAKQHGIFLYHRERIKIWGKNIPRARSGGRWAEAAAGQPGSAVNVRTALFEPDQWGPLISGRDCAKGYAGVGWGSEGWESSTSLASATTKN